MLGREGLQLIETFVIFEKEACKTVEGLFTVLNGKFKPQHNATSLSLQYCKLNRKSGESMQEWMGRLQIKWQSANIRKMNRMMKKQSSNCMNDEAITAEIIKELIVLKDTSEVSSEQVLTWTHTVKVKRALKAVLETIRDARDFDSIRRDRQRSGQNGNKQQREHVKDKKIIENLSILE